MEYLPGGSSYSYWYKSMEYAEPDHKRSLAKIDYCGFCKLRSVRTGG